MSTKLAAFAVLMTLAAPANTAETSIERYHRLTAAAVDCGAVASKADEILVCARRDADRYRLPLIIPDAGDPREEGVEAERVRLQHQTTPCQNYELFLVGCKGVGVSISSRLSGDRVQLRPLAP